MSTHTVPQSAIVNAVKGEVLVLGLDGNVKVIKAGDEDLARLLSQKIMLLSTYR